jgi:hypothetical protein
MTYNPYDPIILIIYIAIVAYVINRMIDSFNDEYKIKLDEDLLKEDLTKIDLQDVIAIGFRFDKQYEFDKLKQLSIKVTNKSKTHAIYVDWDNSTLTDLRGRSRRVTRVVPGNTLDLFQEQVSSAIAPDTSLGETITAEDALSRKDPKDIKVALEMDVAKAIVDPTALKPKKVDPTRFGKFKARVIDLDFYLDLAVRFAGPTSITHGDRALIRCKFVLSKLHWTAALPWNPRQD